MNFMINVLIYLEIKSFFWTF